jgi:type I restriction enzyme S subunit
MPENWKTYTLGELSVDISYGYTESASKVEIGPKFLRITDIQNHFIKWEEVPYCKISDKDAIKYQLEIGDIVIARTGNSTGATALIKTEINAVYASYLIRYQLNKELANPPYIDFVLRSKKWENFVDSIKGGSAQPGANAKQFAEFEITLPPLQQQKSIATILSALDDKIELNLQMNKTLEEMAMALYKHWFVDFGPFQNGKFVNSELGMIPEGWEVKRLDEVCNLTIGRTPPRKEPKWFSQSEGVKWISIKDIGNSGLYISQTSEYLSEEAVKKFNVTIIKPNTVILSFKLTVGRVAISSERMLSNEAIAHLNRRDENFPVEFLYSYLRLFDYNSLGSTSSIATAVNTQTLKAMKITLPTDKLLSDFFSKITDIFQQIKNNQEENHTLTTLRNTLLPKLISGAIRVKDVEQMAQASL